MSSTSGTLFVEFTTEPWACGRRDLMSEYERNEAAQVAVWHSRFRGPVFAESAVRRIEDRLRDWERYEYEQFCRWLDSGPSRGRLSELWERFQGELKELLFTRERLVGGALAERPKRHMPSMKRVAEHHGLPLPPFCVACGWRPPVESWRDASRYLERAHLIDRFIGGLDTEANLAPLCSPCHRMQPIFRPGDEVAALDWFGLGRGCGAEQLVNGDRDCVDCTPNSKSS